MKEVTQLLFYTAPDQYDVEAKIVAIYKNGEMLILKTNPIVFFPGSGGQPADKGWIGEVPVIGYEALPEGTVSLKADEKSLVRYPVVEEKAWKAIFPALPEESQPVTLNCRIDRAHREEYREQHTGQHLASGLLKKLFDVDTVSVHFGEETTTLEIAQESLPEGYREKLEGEANKMIQENAALRTFWIYEEKEVEPLRRKPKTGGPLRVVEIDGIDRTACSGVHLSTLAPLRLLLVLQEERIRGRLRLHILTGQRSVRRLKKDEEVLFSLRSLCTVGTEDLPEVVRSLKEENRLLRLKLLTLQKKAASLQMHEWLQGAYPLRGRIEDKGVYLCIDAEPDWDLRVIEEAFLNQARGIILVGRHQENNSKGVTFLVTQNQELVQVVDLRELLKGALSVSGGKGGGSPNRLQGSFPSVEQWEQFKVAVKNTLHSLGWI
ncbi:MAG: hypothetical protein SNJ78_00075 [Spirochaetales bacterium]